MGESGFSETRVAILVDHPDRDLHGMVLLALRLVSPAVTVHLVPYNHREPELWQLGPDVVLLNNARKRNDKLIEGLHNAGSSVAILDTEGGVFPSVEYYLRLQSGSASVRAAIDTFLAWGPEVGEAMVSGQVLTPKQVAVTGSPKFDLYASPWSSIWGIEKNLKLVLFNGSFSIGNPATSSKESVARAQVENEGFSPEYVSEWQAKQIEALEGLIDLANRTASRLPDVTVVVRPHPFESLAPYRELLHDLPNLRLEREGPIQPWIARASCVIQRGCTTAIEAAIAGVPVISARWLPMQEEIPSTESVSTVCDSPEDAIEVIESVVSNRFRVNGTAQAAVQNVVSRWFRAVDGQSHQLAAATIESLIQQRNGQLPDRDAMLRNAYGLGAGHRTARGWTKASRRLKHAFNLSPQFSFKKMKMVIDNSAWHKSTKKFTANTVQSIAGRLTDAAEGSKQDPFHSYQISQAGTKDYLTDFEGLSVRVSAKS